MTNLPGFTKIGIQHASEMTGNFWDSDITVPSGHHLTQEEGIPATQITNASWISKSSQMIGDFWDQNVVVPRDYTLTNEAGISGEQITSGYISATHIHNLSAGKITSGTLNIDRIPNLNASMITEGTFEKERLSEISYSDLPLQIRLTYDAGNQVYYHYLFDDSTGQSIYSRATYKIINSKLTLIDIYNVDIYELSPYVEYILPDPGNPEQDIKMYLEVIGSASEPTIRGTIIPIIPSTVTNIINSFASSTEWNFGVIDFSYAHCIIDASNFSSSTTSGTIDVSSYTFRQLRKDGLIGTDSQRYLSFNNNILIRIKN